MIRRVKPLFNVFTFQTPRPNLPFPGDRHQPLDLVTTLPIKKSVFGKGESENTLTRCINFCVPFDEMPDWQKDIILAARREGFSGNSENL